MKTIIIIHWFNYWKTENKKEFLYLINKLKKQKLNVILFEYEDRPNNLNKILENLNKVIINTQSDNITLIGFSLGSYISIKYLEKYKNKNIKKIILCVPLVNGSKFFRTIYKIYPNWIKYSGKVIHDASYEKLNYNKIPKNIDVSVIRGYKRINRRIISIFAQILFLGKKNDGLFTISETNFGKKIITLNIGHYESPYSPMIADSIIKIIQKD